MHTGKSFDPIFLCYYTVTETIVFFNKIMILKMILTASHQLEANHELYADKYFLC